MGVVVVPPLYIRKEPFTLQQLPPWSLPHRRNPALARSDRALSLRLIGPLASVLVAVANQSDRTPRSPPAVDEGANVNIVL